ncbi:MAG: transposase [Candidatus Paceibacterota bacterium]
MKLLFICNSKNPIIFKEIKNLSLDEIEKTENIVEIGAYCLMPNHFHILIKEKIDGGISLFINKLLTAYSMYFNKKYERTGKLFEGAFKATHVNNDEYLKYLFSYIHLNPLKIVDKNWRESGINDDKAREYLKNYKYSSYLEYLGENREEKIIINKDVFPKYFEKSDDFKNFINEWINFQEFPRGDLGKNNI